MKGIIALDIDGTITADSHMHTIPVAVVNYLEELVHAGWQLIFITGRSFSTAYSLLQVLTFPYYFAVQNGAIVLEMPSRRIISKKYLDRSIFKEMDAICHADSTDFVIYGGFERGDACYYRPKRFLAPLLHYLENRTKIYKELWYPVESYDDMPLDTFPSIKCFGLYPAALELTRNIERRLGLHVPLIRDPIDRFYYVIQATHPEINKGQAIQDLIASTGNCGRVIAAGDDLNDLSMLAVADVKVVMATAPQELLQKADIIAPPASEEGIIVGLRAALNW